MDGKKTGNCKVIPEFCFNNEMKSTLRLYFKHIELGIQFETAFFR